MSGTFLRRRDRTARPPRVEHYSSAVNILDGFNGILQVDGYAGYNRLAGPGRRGGAPLQLAFCRVGGVVAEPLPSQTRTSRFPASGSSHASFAHGACNL